MPFYPTTGGSGTGGLLAQIQEEEARRQELEEQKRQQRKMQQLQIAQMILGGLGQQQSSLNQFGGSIIGSGGLGSPRGGGGSSFRGV